jgi:hypothetical protein
MLVQQTRSRGLLILALLACTAAGTVSCTGAAPSADNQDDNEPLNAAGSCGTFRWAVKTGTDSSASSVNLTPVDTTLAALVALPKPASLPSTRIAPTELETVRLTNVTLTQYKSESDSDYHLGIVSGSAQLEAEIPSPACASGSAFAAALAKARTDFDAKFKVTGSYQQANIPVTITGVAFFDMPAHGANGAPNGIEMHPLLSICFGQDCAGAATPDFSLSASPVAVTSQGGATATSVISAAVSGGFSSSISLSTSGLPAGATASLSATSISGSGAATLSLNPGSAAPGTYSVVITGTSGARSHQATIAWNIGQATSPDFSLAATPAQVSTGSGTSAQSNISAAAQNGFTGSVALSASGVPSGASASFSPASISGSGSSTLTLASGTAAAGSYTLSIAGVSGSLTHSTSIGWTIGGGGGGGNAIVNGDFEQGLAAWTSVGSTSTSTTVHGGSTAAKVGSVTSQTLDSISQTFTAPSGASLSFWFQGVCTNTVQYAWAGATLADNTSGTSKTLLPNTCTKTGKWVQVNAGALPAGHSLTLTLSSKSEVYKTSSNYTLFDDVVVTGGSAPNPDFSITTSVASVNGSGTATISIAGANGFAGSVSLSASGTPAGSSATFSPGSVAAGTSATLTLSKGTASAGTQLVTITGTSGSLTHSTSLSWTIGATSTPDFILTTDVAAVSSTGTASATATATLAPTGGFNSTVALSVSGAPSGASVAFNPTNVPGGSGSATLTLSPGSATAGSYALKITATAGALTHTAPLGWTISSGTNTGAIQTVFIILMENHNWSSIKGSASAQYINNTLLTQGAHAENYVNVPGIHPSEPNYLWLEAGTNFGVLNDNAPSANHQSTTQHLTALLQNHGISWKSYQEGIPGTSCPLATSGLYAPKHNPMVFFDDVTNTLSASSANCIAHVRPYSELATDLQSNQAARYNFITPNLCNDMHNTSGCATSDSVKNGDNWLAQNVPTILNSAAYKNGGALFITWDESEQGDHPIGMIVMSPKAKAGHSSSIAYSHSSTLRTFQELFGVSPMLGDASNATDLSDLFSSFP